MSSRPYGEQYAPDVPLGLIAVGTEERLVAKGRVNIRGAVWREICPVHFHARSTKSDDTIVQINMTATVLLRIAAIISLLFTAGHTMGGLKKWSPMGENAVLRAMTDVRFEAMGANRSYLDFFMGFGWSISVAMLLQSILLWQMATLARKDAASVRSMIAVFVCAQLASGIIAWRFIFPVPALFSVLLLAPLVAAFVVAR